MTSASPDIVIVGGGIGDGALATVSLEPKLLLCLLTTCSSARAAMAIRSAKRPNSLAFLGRLPACASGRNLRSPTSVE